MTFDKEEFELLKEAREHPRFRFAEIQKQPNRAERIVHICQNLAHTAFSAFNKKETTNLTSKNDHLRLL